MGEKAEAGVKKKGRRRQTKDAPKPGAARPKDKRGKHSQAEEIRARRLDGDLRRNRRALHLGQKSKKKTGIARLRDSGFCCSAVMPSQRLGLRICLGR